MDFLTVALLVVFWFVRPQDIVPSLAGVPIVRYLMIVALVLMFRREKGFGFREVFQTPLDWFLYAYLAWIVWTSAAPMDTFKEVFTLAAFYTTTVLALSTPERFKKYLTVWFCCIMALVLMGIGSHLGVEIVQGSQSITSGFGGRLALNTWIFNNPNSLGHAAVSILPLAYMWLWWRKDGASRILALICMALAGYCVYLTESKGAYLIGMASMSVCLLFGKSLKLQMLILAIVLTAGLSAVKLLPRMDQLNRKEEGIAGRLIIWQMARTSLKETKTGVGWKQFRAVISIPGEETIIRPAHGAYVAVGADLGYGGLFLYIGVLFCGVRVVWSARFVNDEKWERIQRMLLAILTCYCLSAWILDRAYHTDYFLIAAAISAFHRIALTHSRRALDEPAKETGFQPLPEFGAQFAPVPYTAAATAAVPAWLRGQDLGNLPASPAFMTPATASNMLASAEPEPAVAAIKWGRIGFLDIIWIFALLQIVLYLWNYLSTEFVSF